MPCLVCGATNVTEHLDMGRHPVASTYLDRPDQQPATYPLSLGQCESCGVVQLMQPVPAHALVPPAFIEAREPEEHLDEAVKNILNLGVLHQESVIAGLTYKDDSTIDRLHKNGFRNSWRLELSRDLGVHNPAANIETVQQLTNPQRMRAIVSEHEPADLLIVRHIVEHTEDLRSFMLGLAELVKPEGLLMLEIPDCTSSLRHHDYCMLWEEHSLYFTPETFRIVPPLGGFSTLRVDVYPRPFENTIVLLARKVPTSSPLYHSLNVQDQICLLKSYAAAFVESKQSLRSELSRFREVHGLIAIFGAGHLAHAFVNFMDVADLIEFVADDTPYKQGKYLSGSNLPIYPSFDLVARDIKLCLLALSILSEDRVIERNNEFCSAGGMFRSILRESPRSVFECGSL